MSDPIRAVGDTTAVCSALVLTNGWLQVVVGVATVLLLLLRAYESRTVTGAIRRVRCARAAPECKLICPSKCPREE